MRFGHLKMAAAAAALAALPAVATAQNVPPSQTMGFYLGAGIGAGRATFNESTYQPPAGTSWSSDNTELAGKGFVGFRFHKYFGVEGGWDYLGKFKNSYNSAAGSGEATSKLEAWVLDAIGYLPLSPNFTVIGRMGAANGKLSTSVNGTTPSNLATTSDTNTNWTWGAGAQIDVDNHWAFRAEYESFGAFGNTSTGELRASLWSASALYKF